MATEKKNNSKKTPLQIVKQRFGDKKTLVADLAKKLDRPKGESKADLEKKLSKVHSSKLLKLYERAEEVAGVGGRKELINFLHDNAQKANAKKSEFKEDKGYKTHLEKKTTGALYDRYKTIRKKQKKAQ